MKPNRSSSNLSQRSDTDVDTDTEMTDLDILKHSNKSYNEKSDKNYRADKNERGRSQNKKYDSYNQKRSYSNQSNRDRSSSQESNYSKKEYDKKDQRDYKNKSTPHHSRDRKPSQDGKSSKYRSNSNNSKEEMIRSYKKTDDGKLIIDNKIYYTCTCASMHLVGQECPTPINSSKN